jgi:hypothetical protein
LNASIRLNLVDSHSAEGYPKNRICEMKREHLGNVMNALGGLGSLQLTKVALLQQIARKPNLNDQV